MEFEERKRKAMQDKEFLELREMLKRTPSFQAGSKKKKQQMLEQQANAWVNHCLMHEMAAPFTKTENGAVKVPFSAVDRIRKTLSFKYKRNTIWKWLKYGQREAIIDAQVLKRRSSTEEFRKPFDVKLAELFGAYFSTIRHQTGGRIQAQATTLEEIEPLRKLVSNAIGKKVNLIPTPYGHAFSVTARELGSYLKKISGNKKRFPFELLDTKEKKLAFLRGFLRHRGTTYTYTANNEYGGPKTNARFMLDMVRHKHLVYNLLPLFAEFNIHPSVSTIPTLNRIFIEDEHELNALIGLNVLPPRNQQKLIEMQGTRSKTRLTQHTLKDYERVHELYAKGKTVQEVVKTTRLSYLDVLRFLVKRPFQVQRYLKNYDLAKENELPFPEYPFTLAMRSFDSGILEARHKLVQPKKIQGKAGFQTPEKLGFADGPTKLASAIVTPDYAREIHVRTELEKLSSSLEESQAEAFKAFLEGRKHDATHLKNAFKNLRKRKELKTLLKW